MCTSSDGFSFINGRDFDHDENIPLIKQYKGKLFQPVVPLFQWFQNTPVNAIVISADL